MEIENRSCITAATTRGGMSYEQLCRDDQPGYYVCDRECLVHILRKDTLEQAEKKLITKIDTLFKDIEIQKEATIDKFYIGKTYVTTRKHSSMDPLNPWTWIKEGIKGRWQNHKKTDYGKDGMIVIAVITRDQVPLARDPTHRQHTVVHQEDYAFALEQRLLHYYKITMKDPRIANKTFKSGGDNRNESAGYILYVSFGLKKNETREDTSKSVEIDQDKSTQKMQDANNWPLVQPPSTVSLAQSTVSLPQSTVSLPTLPTVSLPQSTVFLPQPTVSLAQSTLSLPTLPTVFLPQSTVSLPTLPTVFLPQSTVFLPQPTVSPLAHLSTLPLAQSTLSAFNMISNSGMLTTIEDTHNDNNECLEEKQRENNDNESSGIGLTCQQETQLNITDYTESSEPQRGQAEKEKGKEQEGIEVYASIQKRTRREKDKNRVKRKYTCSCCRERGHRKPRCPKRY